MAVHELAGSSDYKELRRTYPNAAIIRPVYRQQILAGYYVFDTTGDAIGHVSAEVYSNLKGRIMPKSERSHSGNLDKGEK